MTSFTFISVVHGFDEFLDQTDVELECDVLRMRYACRVRDCTY